MVKKDGGFKIPSEEEREGKNFLRVASRKNQI